MEDEFRLFGGKLPSIEGFCPAEGISNCSIDSMLSLIAMKFLDWELRYFNISGAMLCLLAKALLTPVALALSEFLR